VTGPSRGSHNFSTGTRPLTSSRPVRSGGVVDARHPWPILRAPPHAHHPARSSKPERPPKSPADVASVWLMLAAAGSRQEGNLSYELARGKDRQAHGGGAGNLGAAVRVKWLDEHLKHSQMRGWERGHMGFARNASSAILPQLLVRERRARLTAKKGVWRAAFAFCQGLILSKI